MEGHLIPRSAHALFCLLPVIQLFFILDNKFSQSMPSRLTVYIWWPKCNLNGWRDSKTVQFLYAFLYGIQMVLTKSNVPYFPILGPGIQYGHFLFCSHTISIHNLLILRPTHYTPTPASTWMQKQEKHKILQGQAHNMTIYFPSVKFWAFYLV